MHLPESVQEIAEVIGAEDALFLIGQLPTCETVDHRDNSKRARVMLYVPKRLKPHHRLVQILGEKQAQKLVKEFGGETLPVANCRGVLRQWWIKETRRMHAEGVRKVELADIMGVTTRQIGNWLKATAIAA